MNRTFIAAALALVLTFGATAAYAWHGGNTDHNRNHSSWHGDRDQHGRHWRGAGAQNSAQGQQPVAFDQHGGGHEQAANNDEIHRGEMQNPNHRD